MTGKPRGGSHTSRRRDRGLSDPLLLSLAAQGADLSDLKPVGRRPPLGQYLKSLWQRREFVLAGASGEASARYSRDRLGSAWLVLKPLLDAAFYILIFGVVLRISREGIDNYIAFVVIGVFTFELTSRCINTGTSLIRSSRTMIRAFSFPRASLAFSVVARETMVSMPAYGVMLVLIMAIPPHELPTWTWLLLPLILVCQIVLNVGLVLVFARIGAAWPDTQRLMSFFTRILLYASGVIFPVERFIVNDVVEVIVRANPIAEMLIMYRSILLDGVIPAWTSWAYLGAWAVGLSVIGFLLFWWSEEKYGRED